MLKVQLAVLVLLLSSCSLSPKKNDLESERLPSGNLVDNFLYPDGRVNRLTELVVTPPEGYEREELQGSNDMKIISWTKESAVANSPTVIYIHGNGESLSTIASSQNLKWLSSRDINFIIYDFPKYGESTGELTEKSMLEAANLVFNSTLKKFPQSNIIVFGRSLGTAIAMQLMGQQEVRSRVQGLVLISPWTSFPDLIKNKIGFVSGAFSTEDQEYDNLAIAPHVFTPTLIIHGDEDTVISAKLGETLANAFPAKSSRFLLLAGLGHNDIMQTKALRDSVINFIIKVDAQPEP